MHALLLIQSARNCTIQLNLHKASPAPSSNPSRMPRLAGQKLKRGYQDQHRSYLLDLLQPADGPGAGPTQALQLAGSRQRLGVAPGIGLYYTESLAGVPPVLAFLLPRIPAIHEVTVFLTVRHVPLPTVHASERLLLRWAAGGTRCC